MADTLPSLLEELDRALDADKTARALVMECELKLGLLRDNQMRTEGKVSNVRARLDKIAKEMAETIAAMSEEIKP